PDYVAYLSSVAAIEIAIATWQSGGPAFSLQGLPGFGDVDVVVLLRRALIKCPDQAPAPGTAELAFIPDQEMSESLRLDMSAATTDFASGEWKGATVLSGSVLEALLLWALRKRHNRTLQRAVTEL